MAHTAVVGFQVVEIITTPRGKAQPLKTEKPIGRLYHVKQAAEELRDLLIRSGREAFVRDVYGPDLAPSDKSKSKVRA